MIDDSLVAALEAIARRAGRAVRSLETGNAVNGHTALEAIRTQAEDALRHHAEDTAEHDAAHRFEHA